MHDEISLLGASRETSTIVARGRGGRCAIGRRGCNDDLCRHGGFLCIPARFESSATCSARKSAACRPTQAARKEPYAAPRAAQGRARAPKSPCGIDGIGSKKMAIAANARNNAMSADKIATCALADPRPEHAKRAAGAASPGGGWGGGKEMAWAAAAEQYACARIRLLAPFNPRPCARLRRPDSPARRRSAARLLAG